ncbi:hypothetical protein C5S53_06360 [Methanophagales archaeon]|nr:hypothetical protein C5S53_06360 [Methanophagales archaeon]
MPKATNLIDAYNNFVVEPLKTEEEFRDFYVERPKNAPSPIEELKDRIENADSAKKYLFLGFRGCGKSTELNRLSRMIDRDRFLLVSYSIRELDVSDFDFRDFFGSMALKIYDIAEKDIELEADIKEDFLDFMMHITKVSEHDVTKYRGMGISFSKFILLKLGREAKTREYIRKELETKISDLIQKLNWLTMEVETKTEKRIVVIVDDLDKLTRVKQAEDFFYKNYGLLIQPKCFVIYTFPIPLTFNPYYENVRPAFDDKKEARDDNVGDSTSRDLLFSLTAVEYEDEEGRWCDINPLLMPLVEKWKKA